MADETPLEFRTRLRDKGLLVNTDIQPHKTCPICGTQQVVLSGGSNYPAQYLTCEMGHTEQAIFAAAMNRRRIV